MSDPIEAIKSLISTWEKTQAQAEEMLAHLRAALKVLEPDAPAPASKRVKAKQRQLFSAKYGGQSAEHYLRQVLTASMTLREIQDALAAMGKTYNDQTVMYALGKLDKKGEIEPRKSAPPGSASLYVYGPVKARQEGEPALRRVG